MISKQILASSLSLFFPGAGHIYLGFLKKGRSLFFIDAVILFTYFFSDSLIVKALMIFLYFAVMLPAVVETFVMASGEKTARLSDSPLYIVFMLLTTGFGALPLLWQSNFTKQSKIIWTITVPILALAFFWALYFFRAPIESALQSILS